MKMDVKELIKAFINNTKMNNLGTTVGLTLNVEYTCPCDGYVSCSCSYTGSSQAAARIISADGSGYINIGGYGNSTYAVWTAFVKKGMKIKPTVIANNGTVTFTPLK